MTTTEQATEAPAVAAAIVAKLDAPLDPSKVSTLTFGGRNAPYLEGWYVISAANGIFGYDGWSYEVLSVEPISSWNVTRTRRTETVEVRVTLYQARVRVEALGTSRTDVGTNIAEDATAEAHETAIKGAATDGLKRALRTFGAQFGNELYDKNPPRPAEAPQGPQEARGVAQSAQAVAAGSTIATDGQFYNWCLKEHRQNKTDVLKIPGVVEALNAGDYSAAQREVLSAVTAARR